MCSKQLLLIRHAKSSWKDKNLADIERPLNKRGKKDALFMANILKKKNIYPDLILSSNAKRAKLTAELFCKEFALSDEKISIDERLYEAAHSNIIKVIKEVNENIKTLFVFGHNPGLTTLHNFLCDSYLENIPTCGITQYQYSGEWKDISGNSCRLLSFEFPKKYK